MYGGYEECHHAFSSLVLCKSAWSASLLGPVTSFVPEGVAPMPELKHRRRLRISRVLLLLDKSRLQSCRSILNMLKK